ncbi:MFS transporter [Candidatus Mycobacterium methanotrophicum]|uniref:MFS transporter n=1 Tax=Candidatus Mycobacterium methanotrophicum TaxID=2943498 RepID=A0ABY4QKV8_9MYCO|nr:MFS transporter [Candidatus Mycobacterium methanotrophicum]UQX11117.1 MFS transporter [Candidatus Mycobacterium methanotrophicum]
MYLIDQQRFATGHWRELWSTRYLRTSAVVAGGVVLYSTNEFLTISMLPSTVSEIGGERMYSWVTALYLVGSVVAAATVNSVLHRVGSCLSYLLGFAVLGVGSLVCAAAPTMEILLGGRFLQGLAGGLLCGLSFAVINAVLPRSLWSRGAAMASAMWGVGALLGPALGGVFAQFGAWRWAFGLLAMASVAMSVLAPGILSVDSCEQNCDRAATRIPLPSIILLGAAALSVSVASIPHNTAATAALLIVGAALVGAFLVVDRRMPTAVLPASVFGFGPLKWVYLTLGLLVAATKVDLYVPLFSQRLAHLGPIMAGLMGAALSIGWTISGLGSGSLNKTRAIVGVVITAPVVMALGLALAGATHVQGATIGVIVLCGTALMATGVGIGAAWPHLSAWAMGDVDDPAEGTAAATAINSVQLIFGAFGAGLAGVVVNVADGGGVAAARAAFTVFALLALTACATAYRAGRRQAAL